MKKTNQSGFSIIEALLILVAIGIVGFAGWYVYHAKQVSDKDYSAATSSTVPTYKKKAGTGKAAATTSTSVTSDQLVSVAQKVFWQDAAPASDPPTIAFCGTGGTVCPFTSQLTSKLAAFKGGPGFGPALVGGEQDGPFGVLSFNAVPSSSGGTVTVKLAPSATEASEGNGAITWVLTVQKSNGQLKVSNVTITMAAAGKQPGCGPVEIYNDLSC